MSNNIYLEFKNPSAQYRGKPFWSWNGQLEEKELLRQIGIMKEMGFGGFFMHSRTGLKTEYLGEEWFQLINACADEGERVGMEAWLYDEDRWPSGTAGGLVTEEPKFRMKFMTLNFCDSKDFIWNEDILAAYIAEVEGLDLQSYERIHTSLGLDAYENKTVIYFKVEEMEKSTFYNGFTYLDTLNREATDAFIDITHEKYKSHCTSRMGKSIKGIFTDEPHRGQMMSSFAKAVENPEFAVPWTYELFEEFSRAFGYDVLERLPELFLIYKDNKISQVKWHYVEILQRMFIENFARPVNDWCKQNNLELTGHILHEDNLTSQTAMSGSVMRFYEHMGYPGVDVLCENNKNFWIVKQIASAARQLGKKWMLSELYGCTGWQMTFQGHKNVGDWQALLGINVRCHHLSWYTMMGEAKRDYPASILHQSTWWQEYKHVEDYFSRLGLIMSQGKPCCDTLVINPVESVWCQVYPGWCKGLGAVSSEIKVLEKNYSDLFNWLMGAHIDFDYGDEEMLGRMFKITKDEKGRALLRVGLAAYRRVIVSGMVTMRSSTVNILKEFINCGGIVIFAGDFPSHIDALPSNELLEFANECKSVHFECASIVKACSEGLDELVLLSGDDIEKIYMQIRQDGNNYYILMLNTDRENQVNCVSVSYSGKGTVQEWDCTTGERFMIGLAKDDKLEWAVNFEAAGEHLFVVTTEEHDVVPIERYTTCKSIEINGPFKYSLDEKNVCVLDFARYKINEGEWNSEEEILKIDREVRKHFGLNYRGGDMIQPWFAAKRDYEEVCKLDLCFDFFVEDILPEELELVVENPENVELYINGNNIEKIFADEIWIDSCFKRIPIKPYILTQGKNTITIKTAYNETSGLEAIYLLGMFGVKLEQKNKFLVDLPEKIMLGDVVPQGLPFYSGKINYYIDINEQSTSDEKAFLKLNSFGGACAKVITSDSDGKIMAWQPYETEITETLNSGKIINLQIIGTRRNTFGPLHQIPLYANAYGPQNFVTENECFTEEYMLVPSGLLTKPEILIKRI